MVSYLSDSWASCLSQLLLPVYHVLFKFLLNDYFMISSVYFRMNQKLLLRQLMAACTGALFVLFCDTNT